MIKMFFIGAFLGVHATWYLASAAYIYTFSTTSTDDLYWESIATSTSGQYAIAAAQYYNTLNPGGIFLSNNYGGTWTQVSSLSSSYDWTCVSSDSSGQYLAAGANFHGIFYSTNFGSSWTQGYSSSSFSFNALSASSSGQRLTATLGYSGVLISSNYGASWTAATTGLSSSAYFYSAAMNGTGNVIYISSSSGVYKSTNFGSTFVLSYSSSGPYYSVATSDSGQYAAVSYGYGSVYTTSNTGLTWTTTFSSGTFSSPDNVVMDTTGRVVTVSNTAGSIYQSTNYGIGWSRIYHPTTSNYYYYSSSGLGYGLACSANALNVYAAFSGYSLIVGVSSGAVSIAPTPLPSRLPSRVPTQFPTKQPTSQPSASPSTPTSHPTKRPSRQPSRQPSSRPTSQPVIHPTSRPTSQPSRSPSMPTQAPSSRPSCQPSRQPSSRPSRQPTEQPSSRPSRQPTSNPTNPTSQPTSHPSESPSASPTNLGICPAGTYYKLMPGYVECAPCAAGTYSLGNATSCSLCEAGTYNPSTSATSCLLCPLNTYASVEGLSVCKNCPAGFVSATVGSISSVDCVNPALNFAFGFLCLFAAMFVIWVYLYKGRLLRIAFHRRYSLVRKSIIITGAAARAADLVTSVSTIISTIIRKKNGTTNWKKTWKPIIFFVLAGVIVPLVILLVICYNLVHILFNSLVLWRGYRFVIKIPLDFLQQVDLLLVLVNFSLNVDFFQILAYPFAVVSNVFAEFSINLSAVQVTCSGAQAPILLLLDLIIVGFVIIIIESDLQVFWTTGLNQVISKATNMVFSRYYFSKNVKRTFYYSSVSLGLSWLPDPRRCIQYVLGFVSVLTFFSQNGHGQASGNCNSAEAIPVDTFLAVMTTILAVFMICPVIYMLAQVLVPCFEREKVFSLVSNCCKRDQTINKRNFADDEEAPKPAFFGWTYGNNNAPAPGMEQFVNSHRGHAFGGGGNVGGAQTFQMASQKKKAATDLESASAPPLSESSEGPDDQVAQSQASAAMERQEKGKSLKSSHNSTSQEQIVGALEEVSDSSDDEDDENDEALDEDIKARKIMEKKKLAPGFRRWDDGRSKQSKYRANASWLLRTASSLISVDWLFIKFVTDFTTKMFSRHREFLTEQHPEAIEVVPVDNDHGMKEVEDERLISIREEMIRSAVPDVPWFQAIREMDKTDTIAQAERVEEKALWRQHKKEFPSYNRMMKLVRKDYDKSLLSIFCFGNVFLRPLFNYLCSYILFFQLWSAKGWSLWVRVFKNYVVIFLISIGYWPEFVVQEFKLIGEYKKFKRLLNKVENETYKDLERMSVMQLTDIESSNQQADDYDNEEKKGDSFREQRQDSQSTVTTASGENNNEPEQLERKVFKNEVDAFARIDNDPKLFFMSYVSSIVSARVVLIQLIPIFTLWSIFAVELARCPIFVFSDRMNKRLPPLWVWNPVAIARAWLEQDYKDKSRIPEWKVYILACHIFVRESRLINFAIIVYTNFVSIGLVFFPRGLQGLVVLLVIILLVLGIIMALYILLLLHKFMFPAEEEDEEEGIDINCVSSEQQPPSQDMTVNPMGSLRRLDGRKSKIGGGNQQGGEKGEDGINMTTFSRNADAPAATLPAGEEQENMVDQVATSAAVDTVVAIPVATQVVE